MTPTKIVLELAKDDRIFLRVFAPECVSGSTVIESTKLISGKSLAGLRKQGAAYAKRFNIPFIDQTEARQ